MAEGIQTLIPQYGGLNRIYEDFIADNTFSFGEQKFITDFCRRHGDSQAFETAVLDLILNRPKEQYSLILNSLKAEIDRNIRLYETQALPDTDIIDRVCYRHFKSMDREIAEQMEITGDMNVRLIEANNRYDSIGYRAHTDDEEKLMREEYERRKAKYEAEKAKLDKLYELQEIVRKEATQYKENCCEKIYRQSTLFMSILKKYIPDPEENRAGQSDQSAAGERQHEYFGMRLLSLVHEACSGEQFEEISESSFYACMNLLPCGDSLRFKQGEKARVCHLVFLLSEKLPKQERETWKAGILKQLGIDGSFYASKYKEPVSDAPSCRNRSFVEKMDGIFR